MYTGTGNGTVEGSLKSWQDREILRTMRNGKGARNEAFFQSKRAGSTALSLNTQFRAARETGCLNLSSRHLQQIPSEIFCLDAHVEEGEKFWEVYPLSKVDLSYNEISHLNQEFSQLVDLTSLKVRANRVSTLPSFILGPKLRHLDLSSNAISVCESSISGYLDLQECFLQDNSIDTFPSCVLSARDLLVLDLSNNRITEVPDDICHLRCLTRLSMNGNKLEALPQAFGMTLGGLVTLDLRKNQLTSLPPLTGLTSLQVVDLGENSLSHFPLFSPQSVLSILHLDCNRIVSMDGAALAVLSGLCELHVHDNKLSALCPEVSALRRLKVLDVSNNDIGDLPASLGYMESLQR